MSLGMLRRIEKLEDARRINVPRTFIIWDSGPAHVEAERDRLRRVEGMSDADRVVTVGWLPVQDAA